MSFLCCRVVAARIFFAARPSARAPQKCPRFLDGGLQPALRESSKHAAWRRFCCSGRRCHPGAEGQGAEAGDDAAEAGAVQARFHGGVAVGLHDVFQRFAFLCDRQL